MQRWVTNTVGFFSGADKGVLVFVRLCEIQTTFYFVGFTAGVSKEFAILRLEYLVLPYIDKKEDACKRSGCCCCCGLLLTALSTYQALYRRVPQLAARWISGKKLSFQRLGIPSPGCRTRSKSPRHGTSRDGEWECDCADLLLVQLPEFKEALAWGVLFHLFPDYAGTCHLLRSVADTYAAPSLNGGVRASRAQWHLGLVLRPNQ